MDLFRVLLLLLSGLRACDWSVGARKQEVDTRREVTFKGLLSQRLREVLAQRDPPVLLWNSGALQRKLLYCRVGIGFHLQILSGGVVRGVHSPDPSCWLKVFSVRQGVVGIQGAQSKLYLCMSGTGRVYAAERFTDECRLKETLQENHYNTYSSERFPGLYLGLSHRGEVKRGTRVSPNQPCAHFLPRTTF